MKLLVTAVVAYLAFVLVLWHVDFARRDLYWYVGGTALFVLALFALRRASHRGLSDRATVLLILGFGATLQLVALTRAPLTSDDAFRYAWDARVQFAGVDPYRYAPAADPLATRRRAPIRSTARVPRSTGRRCTRFIRRSPRPPSVSAVSCR